jgi:hypothetical protein
MRDKMFEEIHTSERSIQTSDSQAAESARSWVGLTDKEIEDCLEMSIQGTCRAIEAKLKEKNA